MLGNLEEEVELINRHFEVLNRVIEEEPIGIVRLSNQTGHAHHEVRYSLRFLEENELIEATGEGAITTEETERFITTTDEQLEEIIGRVEQMKVGAELGEEPSSGTVSI